MFSNIPRDNTSDMDPPWVNKDIKKLIHDKNYAYTFYCQNKSNSFSPY